MNHTIIYGASLSCKTKIMKISRNHDYCSSVASIFVATSWMRFFILILLLHQAAVTESVKVSFYGASHIAMPLQEAKISTNIRLRFRTYQENALIFLAAGRTDYSLLSLEDGRIRFIFKIDDHLSELWSPKSLIFNDLNWHDIAIQRYETNITMQVDEHFIKKTIPSRIAEINIHFGVFVGGLGDFSESYMNSIDNFRGCISDVYYNNINVFKRAKERTSHVTSVKVSWSCAAEFDADVHQSISFIEDDSYIVLAKPIVKTGESWNFEFRTIENLATLLYSGVSITTGYDFISLEIVENKLRLLVAKGSNAVELIPDRNVSDGKWHNVSIFYSPRNVEISLDDLINSASFANGSSPTIEVGEEFYIGGLEIKYRKRALMKGSRAAESSFRGCIKNMMINQKSVGFPNFKVTQGVTVDCVWNYPCIERQPCIMSGICQQYGIDEFICHCNQAFCIKSDYLDKYKIFTRMDLPIDLEILAVSPMQMLEGDSIFISPLFIDVLFDYSKLGIMEAGVIFHVIQPPKHGRISITSFGSSAEEITDGGQNKFFSLIDLSTDKVKYIHNGLEQFSDHITIDMQLVTTNREALPDYLMGKHRFVLHANITPVNDAPILNIPSNRILRLTQGIPKVIGPDLLSAEDPDSPPSSLMYTILASPQSSGQYGRIEVAGKMATTFSQTEINKGLVMYVIDTQTHEDTSFEIAIQVSDGMETSPAVLLRVSVVPLQLRMINNTGLILVHKSYAIITASNLSFISNSEEDAIDVKFDIVQPPQFGNVQKLRTVDSSWITVDSFTSNQVMLGQVRYLHTTDLPLHDEFKFTASLGPITTLKYDFRITFTKLKIGLQRQENLKINGSLETIISSEFLFHQTTPLSTFSRNIIYTVIKPPRYGLIFVEGYPEFAKIMDSFTQQDIDRNLIRYKTHMTCYSSFVDIFEFIVSVPECEDVTGKLNIIFYPQEELSRTLIYQTPEKITVSEGRAASLSTMHFEVVFDHFKELTFNVSQQPKFGSICNYDDKNKKIIIINSFTFDELVSRNLYYCHDDSESATDSFQILVLSDPETNFQYVCQLSVEINLLNDNEPYSMGDKIFYVVREESKILSGHDLKYIDNDLNTSVSNIFYTQVQVPNGLILKSDIVTDEFTQEDLDNRKILFKHHGAEYGKMSFLVSDGVFEVPGILEIQASDPFLKVKESNASVVQEGKFVIITKDDLSIETNLNTEPEDIDYRILEGPKYGVLKLLRRRFNATGILPRLVNLTSINNFTQIDINREKLAYWNTEVASMDKIRYRVTTKGIWTEGELPIRIYPAAYWDLLQIRRNQTLYVEESTSVIISRDILEIVHPKISPGDITYLVTTSPQHGYLEIQSITLDDEYNSKVFDQYTINAEKMFYIQAGINQSSDYFIFDVTNGITWLRDLMLKIIIIPENLYISTKVVPVEEGQSVILQPDDMIPFSEYYNGKILEYKIIQQPIFGNIKSGKSSKVNRFTQKQLEAGLIHYIHNGSENSSDTIKLIAMARNKESVPFDLKISIIPVNDEVPNIVTNTGLHMWVGGKSFIKNSDLKAQDYDTPAENLTFFVEEISGGYLAYNNELNINITMFTQSDIDEEHIVFIHTNTFANGQIIFYVSDGVHNTSQHILFVTVNPVTLIQVKNENLHVFPLTRKQIMPEQLFFKCSDEDRSVKYIITIPPQMGRILYEYTESGMTNEVSEFTQIDINNGRILYEHTHAMVELKSNDSFYFDVTTNQANSLMDQIFVIDISVSSGGLLRFLPVPRIILDEGDLAPIKLDLSKVLEYLETRAGIQSPELYIEAFSPMHGTVELMDFGSNNVSRMTLNDFNTNRVYYKHDHSDTTEDKLLMSVYLVQGQIFLCNLTIPVTINPINDQPFYLKTQSPHISVVEGENKTITELELFTEDADTASKDIIYDIISGPTVGVLFKISDEGVGQDIITYGNQFSQADINDGHIIYIHTGKAQSTTFYFKVSDGKFKPAYEIFNINILSITINPGLQNEMILVPQGLSSALIETRHLYIDTNVHKTRLMYNITATPSAGMILRNDKPILRFSQMQLEDHEISFMQTDMTKSNDTFQVTAYIPDTNYGGVITVKVIVHPFITINTISVTTGDKIRLSSISDPHNPTLSNLYKYNPKIIITKKPKYGRLKKITRNSGDIENFKDKDITSFTFKDLNSSTVYFVAKKLPEDVPTINDSFEYILTMKSVQPAQGIVPIRIYSHLRDSPNDDVIVANSSLPFNYLLIVSIVASLIILLLFLIILIKCRSNGNGKNNNVDKDFPPPTLPRPPEFMTLNNNRMNSSSDVDSIPITTAASTPLPGLSNVPQCKVIPIGFDNDYQDSESDMMADMNLMDATIAGGGTGSTGVGGGGVGGGMRYPYGDDNEDWSSSYDVCNDVSYSSVAQPQQQNRATQEGRTNPLLRRNQYWV